MISFFVFSTKLREDRTRQSRKRHKNPKMCCTLHFNKVEQNRSQPMLPTVKRTCSIQKERHADNGTSSTTSTWVYIHNALEEPDHSRAEYGTDYKVMHKRKQKRRDLEILSTYHKVIVLIFKSTVYVVDLCIQENKVEIYM